MFFPLTQHRLDFLPLIAESAGSMVDDAIESASTNATRTSTRNTKGIKISDYFAKRVAISAPPTRQNSAQSITSSAASSLSFIDTNRNKAVGDACETPSNSDQQPTEYKITAGNGREVARRLQIPPKKRIKQKISDDEQHKIIPSHPVTRAKLGLLPSLPLDTLFEIFRHLLPIDILHLSRTTKAFRKLLLHRSATGLWKDVLLNVEDVPSCPPGMSLPSWVNLLFDNRCHNCLARNASKCIDFLLCARYCSKCFKTQLSPDDEYDKEKKEDAIILRAVPFSRCEHGSTKRYCVVSTRDVFLRELASWPGDRSAFIEERHNDIKARAKHAALCKKWYARMIKDRSDELDTIRNCRQDAIREKLSALGYEKELDFTDRLARNWRGGCAVIPRPKYVLFKDHDLVKQCKPLTVRTWANIKDAMVDYMDDMHLLRLLHERCLVVRRRRIFISRVFNAWRRQPENLEAYPAESIMPGLADVLEWFIAREITEKLGDEMVTEGEAARLRARLPEFVEQFRRSKVCFNLWRMCDYIFPPDDFLSLAIVVFRCKNKSVHRAYERNWLLDEGILSPNQPISEVIGEIRECMWYPEYIFHPCCTTIRRPWEEEVAEENLYLGVHKEFLGCRRDSWNVSERLEFDEKASRMVKNLLDASGLNHKTKVAELDERDCRFVCLKCSFGQKSDGERRARVWSWRDAVHHAFKAHFGDAQVKWECISPEDTAKARELEQLESVKRGYLKPGQQKLWKCIACRNSSLEGGRMTWSRLRQHFRHHPNHGNENEMDNKEGALYYKALGYALRERPPVKMIPGKVFTG